MSATSRALRSTPSSTPPTKACWVAAESTARYIARRDRALLEECRALGGCPTGEARITDGHKLQARHVIHTVGPVWRGGSHGEDDLLAACYRNALALAKVHDVTLIAFPAISTGAYRFPAARAARIAVETVRATLARVHRHRRGHLRRLQRRRCRALSRAARRRIAGRLSVWARAPHGHPRPDRHHDDGHRPSWHPATV